MCKLFPEWHSDDLEEEMQLSKVTSAVERNEHEWELLQFQVAQVVGEKLPRHLRLPLRSQSQCT